MVMCWAPECKHYNNRDACRFFKFPSDAKSRNHWKKLIRRDVEPGPGAFVCSCHFLNGKRENGPTLFTYNSKKRFGVHYLTPEKKLKTASCTAVTEEAVTVVDVEAGPSTSKISSAARNIFLPTLEEQSSCTQDHSSLSVPSTSTARNIFLTPEEQSPFVQDHSVPSLTSTCTQEQPVIVPTSSLEAENYFLKNELENCKQQIQHLSERFSYSSIQGNNKLVLLYTGLPSSLYFESLYGLIQNVPITYYLKWTVKKISKKDQLFLTLMKLRQNFPHDDLAQRFGISQAAVTNIIITWLHVLHETLFQQLMQTIPHRNKNKACLPNCFSTFTNCRIILDCTEIYTAVSRISMAVQKATYSSYKHRNTWKGLVGVAPNGVITFVSRLYPGSTSDKKIVQHCGILQQLEAGDLILADKGFLIRDALPAGVHLNIPPFLMTAQFTLEQVKQTERIARARIHVERAIGRMKCFQILKLIPHNILQYTDEIFQVIAALTNLQYPLIKEVEQYYNDNTDL